MPVDLILPAFVLVLAANAILIAIAIRSLRAEARAERSIVIRPPARRSSSVARAQRGMAESADVTAHGAGTGEPPAVDAVATPAAPAGDVAVAPAAASVADPAAATPSAKRRAVTRRTKREAAPAAGLTDDAKPARRPSRRSGSTAGSTAAARSDSPTKSDVPESKSGR